MRRSVSGTGKISKPRSKPFGNLPTAGTPAVTRARRRRLKPAQRMGDAATHFDMLREYQAWFTGAMELYAEEAKACQQHLLKANVQWTGSPRRVKPKSAGPADRFVVNDRRRLGSDDIAARRTCGVLRCAASGTRLHRFSGLPSLERACPPVLRQDVTGPSATARSAARSQALSRSGLEVRHVLRQHHCTSTRCDPPAPKPFAGMSRARPCS